MALLQALLDRVGAQIAFFARTDEKFKAIAQACSAALGGDEAMREVSQSGRYATSRCDSTVT